MSLTSLCQRYVFVVWRDADGIRVKLTCLKKGKVWDEKLKQEVDNPRSPEPGSVKWFLIANESVITKNVHSLMMSLTDDQCDSFFPQERVKKSKK